jgi:four helix bundle protein
MELDYQVSLAARLKYLRPESAEELQESCAETARVLAGLIRSLRRKGKS